MISVHSLASELPDRIMHNEPTNPRPGRHAEIVPRDGCHYVRVDGQEWSRHDSLEIAEGVRNAIVERWAAEYERRMDGYRAAPGRGSPSRVRRSVDPAMMMTIQHRAMRTDEDTTYTAPRPSGELTYAIRLALVAGDLKNAAQLLPLLSTGALTLVTTIEAQTKPEMNISPI
jgi:hypothetical protein